MNEDQKKAISEAKTDPDHISRSIRKYMSSLGKKGGVITAQKYGKDHYSRMGKLSTAKRWGKPTDSEQTLAT